MDKEKGQQSGGEPKNPMTKEDAARIQSSYAKQHGGEVDKGSFPTRAQAAADKHENKNKEGGQQSGGDPKNPMTKEDAARIQSSYAKQHGGEVDKGSFPTRAQAAADKHANKNKEGGQQSGGDPKNPMTKEDAARIQRAYAKQHGGKVDKGSFPARAQAAADKRENKKKEEGGQQSGGEQHDSGVEKGSFASLAQSTADSGEHKDPMTKEDAARIRIAEAKQHGGEKGSFAASAHAAADKRENQPNN